MSHLLSHLVQRLFYIVPITNKIFLDGWWGLGGIYETKVYIYLPDGTEMTCVYIKSEYEEWFQP